MEQHNLLSVKDGQIIYKGLYMEMFIPDDFMKKKLAEEIGTGYKLFGNFITYHYFSKDDTRETAKEASFEFPMTFHTYPDDTTTEKLDIGFGLQKYNILHYHKNSILFKSQEIIMNSDNVEKLMSLLMEGKLDNMDYDRIPSMVNLCKSYNGVRLKVPAIYEEVLVSEYYRNIDDITRPARFTAEMTGTRVKGLTLREKAAFTSTFSAITFEDKKTMLTVADNAKREDRKELISDVERIALGL